MADDLDDKAGVPGVPRASGMPRQLRPTDVKRLNREWRRRTRGRLALLLDSVAQPFNVGSIVRSAAAFGVESIWLCGNTPDLTMPAVGKTALGTDRFVAAYREPSPAAAAKAATEDGFRVVAVELASGAVPSAWRSATRTTAAPPPCWPWSRRRPTSPRSAGSAR
jgi:tRNA (guanosine-2'-O-)-methyltransferase